MTKPHFTPPPRRPNRALIVFGVIAAVVLALCLLGVIGNALAGKDDAAGRAGEPSSSPVHTGELPKPSVSPTPTRPVELEMPDLVGKNAAVAKDELARLGFTNIQLGSADENDTLVIMAANWKVVEQSAKPGDELPADALIVLTCSKKK